MSVTPHALERALLARPAVAQTRTCKFAARVCRQLARRDFCVLVSDKVRDIEHVNEAGVLASTRVEHRQRENVLHCQSLVSASECVGEWVSEPSIG